MRNVWNPIREGQETDSGLGCTKRWTTEICVDNDGLTETLKIVFQKFFHKNPIKCFWFVWINILEKRKKELWYVSTDLVSFICMSLFSSHTFLYCYSEKDCGLTIYTPASISPSAALLLSRLAVSQASSCLLLCKVIEMQHEARWQAHTDTVTDTWVISSVKTGELGTRQTELLPSPLLSLLRIKDMSKARHPRAPFHSLVLFCLNNPQLLHHPFPSQNRPRKIKQQREEHGGF